MVKKFMGTRKALKAKKGKRKKQPRLRIHKKVSYREVEILKVYCLWCAEIKRKTLKVNVIHLCEVLS